MPHTVRVLPTRGQASLAVGIGLGGHRMPGLVPVAEEEVFVRVHDHAGGTHAVAVPQGVHHMPLDVDLVPAPVLVHVGASVLVVVAGLDAQGVRLDAQVHVLGHDEGVLALLLAFLRGPQHAVSGAEPPPLPLDDAQPPAGVERHSVAKRAHLAQCVQRAGRAARVASRLRRVVLEAVDLLDHFHRHQHVGIAELENRAGVIEKHVRIEYDAGWHPGSSFAIVAGVCQTIPWEAAIPKDQANGNDPDAAPDLPLPRPAPGTRTAHSS